MKDSGEPLLLLQSGEGENPLLMQLKTLNSNLKDVEVIVTCTELLKTICDNHYSSYLV